MLIINTKQVVIVAILISMLSSAIVIGYDLIIERYKLPTVVRDSSGACVEVLQTQNGDAYNCNDVNVVLRRYTTNIKG